MKLPGEAWVEWTIAPEGNGSVLRQTALMRPRGLLGRAYWWLLLPFHKPIFWLMAKRLAERATRRT